MLAAKSLHYCTSVEIALFSATLGVVPSLDTFSMATSVRYLRHMTTEVYYSTLGVTSLGTGRSYLEKPSSTQRGPEAQVIYHLKVPLQDPDPLKPELNKFRVLWPNFNNR